MDLEMARIQATILMHEHGLLAQGWKFEFNNRRFGLGVCDFGKKTIFLSRFYTELNPWEPEMKDTVLHEIAHFLAGPWHGHDRVWKLKCIEIGAIPRRCAADAKLVRPDRNPEKKYKATCVCGEIYKIQRKGKYFNYYRCRTCREQLVFKPNPAYYSWFATKDSIPRKVTENCR